MWIEFLVTWDQIYNFWVGFEWISLFSQFPAPVEDENAAASPQPNQELQLSASAEHRGGAGGREVELQTKVTEDYTKFYNNSV